MGGKLRHREILWPINHGILLARLARKAKDKRILKLIRLYLRSGLMVRGVKIQTQEGIP